MTCMHGELCSNVKFCYSHNSHSLKGRNVGWRGVSCGGAGWRGVLCGGAGWRGVMWGGLGWPGIGWRI